MLEIRIFRFDVKINTLSYYKPYIFEKFHFKTIKELLNNIKQNDPYFSFENVKFIKINNYISSLDETVKTITQKFGNELLIEPLSTKYAYKDLNFYDDDFVQKFVIFKNFKEEKDFYLSLQPHFYANKAVFYSENFLGNSVFVFAKYLLEKYSDKKDEILSIVKDQMPYYYPGNFINDPFNCDESYKFLLNLFKFEKDIERSNKKITENFNKNDYIYNLNGFNIAVYNNNDIKLFLKNFNCKVLNFRTEYENCGSEIYSTDKKCALNLAGEILFDAYDGGSDFLIVENEDEFNIFDEKSDEIQKLFNRSLSGYYVLRFDELVSLLKGEKPKSLKKHKLKVTIVKE